MEKQYLCLNKNNMIMCKGTVDMIKAYLKQIDLDYIDYYYVHIIDNNEVFSDFNIIKMRDIDLYLLEGQYQIIKSELKEEKQPLEYMTKKIQENINSNIFSENSKNIMKNILKELDVIKAEHSEYLKGYFNIDKTSLINLTLAIYEDREKSNLPNKPNL